MKLSEIKGETLFDVISDLIVPVANIAVEKEASELFRRKPLPEGMTVGQFVAERAKQAVPFILKKHKDDAIEILSVLSLKSREEYLENLDLMSLINDIWELITDDCFTELFFSAQTNAVGEPSGSVPENTGDGMPEPSSDM